jgi:hypothetical protein
MSISSTNFISGYTKIKQDYLKFQSAIYKASITRIAIGDYFIPSKLCWLYLDLFDNFEYNDADNSTQKTIIKADGTTFQSYFNINQMTNDEYSTCFKYLSKVCGSTTYLKF